jgi:hypothetical protein
MSWMLKVGIVVLCFSLCGAGTFIVSMPQAEKTQQKTNVLPVQNPKGARPVWIFA